MQRLLSVSVETQTGEVLASELVQNRELAVQDLVEASHFALSNGKPGPYRLHVSVQEQRIVFEVKSESGVLLHAVGLILAPFRRVVKDYFQILDSYTLAMKSPDLRAIEAIDMARRGIHNEGSEILRERLDGKIDMDFDTARRMFTLLCAVMPRGAVTRPVQPRTVLFVCTMNSVRSPMAAAITHHFYGQKIYAASAGVAAGDPDPFVSVVMDELGIDLKFHRPHSLDQEDLSFDLTVTLSPEAGKNIAQAEHWNIPDPSATQGSREQIMDAYRAVRDELVRKVKQRFG